MKKALFVLATVATGASAFAQATVGNITFADRNIPKAANDGTTYNVPIWQPNGTTGAGTDSAGNITVGLFTAGGTTPFATAVLRTDANSQFFASVNGGGASAPVDVPGSTAGTQVALTVEEWSTSAGSFAAAQNTAGALWGTQTFTSKALGGTPAGGGLPVTTPGMTGWGTEDGAGLVLTRTSVPEPTTIALGVLGVGALVLARRRK